MDVSGTLLGQSSVAHAEAGGGADAESMAWRDQVRHAATAIEDARGPASWVGLAAPGMAAPDGRSIAFLPGRLQGLEGLDWTECLERETQVPVLNDAQAALMGEAWQGAAKGLRNVILLTLGTGVGGAIIADGQLLRGHIGRAGHLGHLCLDPNGKPGITGIPGSLEDAIGECTLAERTNGLYKSTLELVTAANQGNDEARDIWRTSVRALACAIASFANILDPEAVVLGGGIAKAGKALLTPLQMYLDEVEWRPGGHQVRVVCAELGEFAGAIGAARNAMLQATES